MAVEHTGKDFKRDGVAVLNLLCTQGEDGWHLYVRPTWLPRYLHRCFDRHGEAYPVQLDFDDLDRQMAVNGADYQKHVSKLGDVELTGRGRSAVILAEWLAAMFASGVRTHASAGDGAAR